MNRKEITIESLVANDAFQKYCLAPEPQDVQFWENWLVEHPQHQADFEQAKTIVGTLSFQLPETEIQGEFEIFQQKINQPVPVQKSLKSNRRIWLSRVAAVFLLLMMAFGAWKMWSPQPLNQVSTEFGKTKTFELSDGSQVVLNANSNLEYAADWDKNATREVWLKGEAFFEVQHTANQKFVVHTDRGDVEVLGTKFNVMQRSSDFNVTLVSGKVQLSLPNKTKINLQPNDQVRINNRTIDHHQVDVETVTAWRYNKMVFKNATIESIVVRLENDFGWEVKVQDKELLKRKINASIPENNPKLLLEALSAIYDLKIEKINEQEYVIE